MIDRDGGASGRQSPPDARVEDLSPPSSHQDAAPPSGPEAQRRCARCGAAVRWRETKFCLDRRSRFGGRVYCVACQSAFPPA